MGRCWYICEREKNSKKQNIKIKMGKIKTLHIILSLEQHFYIAINLCVPNYQVPPTTAYKYLEALQIHVTVQKDISITVFNLEDKIYRNEYITFVNDMDWLPCLGELSNHFYFDYVGSLIMNHKYIGNEDAGRSNVYF